MLDIIRGQTQSLFTKIIFGLIILAFIFLGVGNFTGQSSAVVATVNGENITIQEFYSSYRRTVEDLRSQNPGIDSNPAILDQIKRTVLSQMVVAKLKEQVATELGLFVSSYDLLDNISAIPVFHNEQGKFDPDIYKKFLQDSRLSAGEFESGQKKDLLIRKLDEMLAATVGVTDDEARNFFSFLTEKRTAEYVLFPASEYEDKAEVTDAMIVQYYETHKQQFLVPAQMDLEYVQVTPEALSADYPVSDEEVAEYYAKHTDMFAVPEQFHIQHIYMKVPAPGNTGAAEQEMLQKAREKMQQAHEEAVQGKDFLAVADEYSDNMNGVSLGGDLGWLQKGDTGTPAFEDPAFALNPGEISEIVHSALGLHLIKLVDKQPAGTQSLEEAAPGLKKTLALEKALEDESRIREFVSNELGQGTPLADIAKELKLTVTTTGLMDKRTLPGRLGVHEEAMAMIENIPVGETAPAPIDMDNGVLLVKVLASEEEFVPALDTLREKITAELKSQEAVQLAAQAAENALKDFTGSDVPAGYTTLESKEFSRSMPLIMPLGSVPQLSDALFAAEKGKWLPATYTVVGGAVIARLADVKPFDEAEWKKQSEPVKQNLMRRKQEDLREAFMQAALKKSKIQDNWSAIADL